MATSTLPAPFLTISTQEHSPSPSCSPTVGTNPLSPRVSPAPSSPLFSPITPNSEPHLIHYKPSQPNCLEERLRTSFEQHQEYQKQMRQRILQADHPLHHPTPEAAQQHYQHLSTQLEYYRQLQIMHCQRARDVELLHQQQIQQQAQPLHVVKRFQLAQRMLQMQKIYHAQQIQKIQYLQKITRLQAQSFNNNNNHHQEIIPVDTTEGVTEEDIAKLEIDPNTIHIPARTPSRPRLDLHEILGSQSPPPSPNNDYLQELSRVVLPSSDQIRKLRRQRLKHQARLRQSMAEAKAKSLRSPTQDNKESAPSSEDDILEKQDHAGVWTSSTTLVVPRSTAELQYKRQLRQSMALQQHMIQDHTHRYRIFQAFCLLQRAREAQALDEVQIQKRKQLQTLAWVEALRRSKELEVPQ
ncbi:hypothetical protein BGZ76_003220 [Entomortierella beljakovae]|nr:hypothetical protein BGZ76_003220 [Entomortierella beljakovae]